MSILLIGILAMYFFPMILGDRGFNSDGQRAAYFSGFELWSPGWATGWPTVADPVSMALYPVRLMLSGLEMPFDIFVLTAYAIAILGMYSFLLCVVEKWAAAFGAIIFSLSGWMLAHLNHTSMIHAAAWLPWMMLGVQLVFRNIWPRRLIGVAVLALAVSMSFLAGHPQITIYSFLLVFLYCLFMALNNRGWNSIYWVVAGALCGLAISAPGLLPAIEWTNHTLRSGMSKEELFSYSLPFAELPGLLIPLLYGATPHGWFGIDYRTVGYAGETITFLPTVGVLLSIVAMICISKSRRLITFFLVFGFLSLMLATGDRFVPFALITEKLFPLNMFRAPARHMLEVTFCFSVVSAIGLQGLLRREYIKYEISLAMFVMVLLFVSAVSWALASSTELKLNILNLIWPITLGALMVALSLALLLFRGEKPGSAVLGGLFIIVLMLQTAMIGYQMPWKVFAPVDAKKDMPAWVTDIKDIAGRDYRVLGMNGWQSLVFNPDVSRFHGINTLGWYGPLLNNSVAQLTGLTNGGWIQRFVLSNDDISLDVLSVRYVSIGEEERSLVHNQPDRWAFVKSYGNEYVYENKRVLPRARLVCHVSHIEDDSAFNMAVRSGNTSLSVPDTIYVNNRQVGVVSSGTQCEGQARVLEDDGDELRIEAHVNSGQAFLVVSDLWYPGWKVFVNGKPKELFRANNTSRGVMLENGTSVVEFVYRPTMWSVSIFISTISLLLVFAAVLASGTLPRLRLQA